MHICFVALSYPVEGGPSSGVGSQVRVLAKSLVDRGHSVSVVTLGANKQIKTDENQVDIHCVTNSKLHWYASKLPFIGRIVALPVRELEYSFAAWRGVRQANRNHKIDVVEGTETGMLLIALTVRSAAVLIRLHGDQYTFDRHTPNVRLTAAVRFSRMLQRLALRRAQRLISPSEAHAREIAKELNCDHEAIPIVPNCTDLEVASARSSGSAPQPAVLFVGRFERVKGLLLLLQAARLVVNEFPAARFVLAGGTHPTLPLEEIHATIDRYSLQQHIELRGYVPAQELVRLYHEALLCVVPSHYESFGLVALESMACGLPVVASGVGGLAEVVDHDRTGLLVPPGDAEILAKEIIGLLNDPQRCRRMGEAGRQRTRERFAIENSLKRTLAIYEATSNAPSAFQSNQIASPV